MEGGDGGPLEREDELGALDRQLDRAISGAGSLTVVEGVAGIGKTTLLGEAVATARARGMAVLGARGGVLEQHLDFGVVKQLVERPVMQAGPERRSRLLSGPAAPAGAILGLIEPPGEVGPGHDPSLDILNGLHWLTANLAAERPTLMVIDDAQWSDFASQRAGGYLARRIDDLPIAMLLAVRTDEPATGVEVLSEQLQASDPLYIRPRPLGADSASTVVSRAFGGNQVPASLAEACLEASAGNPFFLTELAFELASSHDSASDVAVDSVVDAGPTAVRRSLLMRLGRLGEGALGLAQAVAALGGEGELRHALEIAGLEAEEGRTAADRLVDAEILRGAARLRMVHPLVRAAVADEMPASLAATLQARAFEVLRADGATDDELLPHALSAEPSGRDPVRSLLQRTAERALRMGNPATAAVHLERALAEGAPAAERAAILAELGRAEVRAGAFDDARSHLDRALVDLSDPAARMEVHRDRALAVFASTGIESARELVDEALAESADDRFDGALQLEADLALLAWLSGSDHHVDLDRHRDVDGSTRAERTILAVLAQKELSRGGDAEAVIELSLRALAGGRLIAEDTTEALSWYLAVYALLACEAVAEARESIAAALADAERRGSAFAHAGALGARAVLALNEGRPRDAEADAREAAAGAMPPTMAPVNSAFLVMALVDQGDLDGAALALSDGGIEDGPGGPTVLRFVPWARARLREAQGRPSDVRADLAPLLTDEELGVPMRALAWRALLARALAREGEHGAEAASLAVQHLSWAEGWGRTAALGIAQRAAALAGPSEDRIEGLETAVETLAGSVCRTEEARARLDLGIALLRAGERSDGREALEAALQTALACDAKGVAEVAAEELEIAGAPARRLSFDELTPSERRVAEHAAAGETNREIADRLFVTPKTVENHLTRAYAKLGIASRGELSEVL